MGPVMINIVVALDCEAKPLIERFKLKRQQDHAYPIYSAENIQLIVSGVGKLNSATATGYLAGLTKESSAWLNIGIAGHKTHEMGALYLAHKITDRHSEQSWYPAFTFKTGIETESLATFDAPVNDYHDALLHDMETAGFYHAASRFNSAEFVHCLKIISDNAENATHKINKQMVADLVTGQIEPIAEFVTALNEQLVNWNDITATPAVYDDLLQHWHFSTYQQHQLRQLVIRWSILYLDQELLSAELSALKNSRDVLKYLQDSLDIVEVV